MINSNSKLVMTRLYRVVLIQQLQNNWSIIVGSKPTSIMSVILVLMESVKAEAVRKCCKTLNMNVVIFAHLAGGIYKYRNCKQSKHQK